MAKDRDEELNSGVPDNVYSLEEMLVEYEATRAARLEEVPFPRPEREKGESAPPKGPRAGGEPPAEAKAPEAPPAGRREPKARKAPPPREEPSSKEASAPEEEKPRRLSFLRKKATPTQEGPEKVVSFPAPPPQSGIEKLRERADDYAQHMFEEEGVEHDKTVRRAERYLPGVDVEEQPPMGRRRARRVLPAAPDLPPGELYQRRGRGLSFLRLRAILVILLSLPLLYVTAAPFFRIPLPGLLGQSYELQVYTLAGLLGAGMLLGADVLLTGLLRVFKLGMGMDTLVSLSCAATLADALTLIPMGGREGQTPYCAISALALGLTMWGSYLKRRGDRRACRTAAMAQQPYLVTLDEEKWNGKDTYAKWTGELAGFGSQIQAPDGAQRIFRFTAPLLFLAALLFSTISSVGQKRPELILWCLSAHLTAAASFSGTLCYAIPWDKLSARLSRSGAALAGWDGTVGTGGGEGILLTDRDLFPVGSVSLNGIKIFGSFSVEKVVGCAATLIRASGCELEKIFHDLLRTQGAVYRRCDRFSVYEGGLAAEIRGEQIFVGSSAFMHLMEIPLPQGLNVKNAVFCAIDGELAGVFALSYNLHNTVRPALSSLIRNRISPVLCTRDFNLIPDMLRQRFKLPVEKMEVPAVEGGRELSDEEQEHSATLSAVLCREGLAPFAEAVVGARRLRGGVRLTASIASVGSAVGLLLCFYLTFVRSFASLSPANLLIFMVMWTVPTLVLSGWVTRY